MAKQAKAPGIRIDVDMTARSFTAAVKQGDKVLDNETFYMADLPEAILAELELRGAAAVLGQRASEAKGDAIAKLESFRSTWASWEDGKYRKDREVGARTVAPIIEVLAKVKKADTGAVQKSWSKLSEEQQEALKKKFSAECEAILEARSKADVDLDDLI